MKYLKALYWVILYLSIAGCLPISIEDTKEFDFDNISIDSIQLTFNDSKKITLTDSAKMLNLKSELENINSEMIVRGKREHGAINLYKSTIYGPQNPIMLLVTKSSTDGVFIDFYEQSEEDNFSYFIGSFYNGANIDSLFRRDLIINDSIEVSPR